jgi:hypothetical protein
VARAPHGAASATSRLASVIRAWRKPVGIVTPGRRCGFRNSMGSVPYHGPVMSLTPLG